ncbi:MAG: hypothetical protein ACOX5Q_01635 [Bacillota bacterium]|jgi:hypothetical protein|nr:hypothetical protein [Candidatus Fermentithermobacillaceae bacterium]
MSRFLRVGFISDRIGDIIEASSLLLAEMDGDERAVETVQDILAMAKDVRDFLARWSSEPIIYTGPGTTDEVIAMLDTLITRARQSAS